MIFIYNVIFQGGGAAWYPSAKGSLAPDWIGGGEVIELLILLLSWLKLVKFIVLFKTHKWHSSLYVMGQAIQKFKS